jgi:hypothetical protein
MLRIYLLQQCFNLSDSAVDEALYEPGLSHLPIHTASATETTSSKKALAYNESPPGSAGEAAGV